MVIFHRFLYVETRPGKPHFFSRADAVESPLTEKAVLSQQYILVYPHYTPIGVIHPAKWVQNILLSDTITNYRPMFGVCPHFDWYLNPHL